MIHGGKNISGFHGRCCLAPPAGRIAADLVCHPSRCHPGEPCPGIVRKAVPRPLRRRCDERLLDRVLGQVDVAEDADEDRDGAPGLLAEYPGGRFADV